jgi:hypothetical protein
MEKTLNVYERAFEAWLRERQMPYRAVDQSRRREFKCRRVKSFDFAMSTPAGLLLADVKGRLFRGASLAGLKGVQTWVTQEDVRGLEDWRKAMAEREWVLAGFVFAYQLTQVEVETDGVEIVEFEGRRFVFLLVLLDDYQKAMKRRSPRWQTVYLPAEVFRRVAVPLAEWIEQKTETVVSEF